VCRLLAAVCFTSYRLPAASGRKSPTIFNKRTEGEDASFLALSLLD